MARLILGVFVGFVLMSVIAFPLGETAPAMVGERYADAQTGMVTMWYIFVVQWPIALMTSVVSGIAASLVAGRDARESAIRTLAIIFIAIGLFSAVLTFVADLRGDIAGSLLDVGDEPAPEKQVARRVTADSKLGKQDQFRSGTD